MLNVLNTKLLIAILAALAVLGSVALYQRHESAITAAAAAKAAAILQEQRKEAEQQKARDDAFRKQVEQDRAHHNSAAGHEGKTWKTYLP